jgi:hypothetical protein
VSVCKNCQVAVEWIDTKYGRKPIDLDSAGNRIVINEQGHLKFHKCKSYKKKDSNLTSTSSQPFLMTIAAQLTILNKNMQDLIAHLQGGKDSEEDSGSKNGLRSVSVEDLLRLVKLHDQGEGVSLNTIYDALIQETKTTSPSGKDALNTLLEKLIWKLLTDGKLYEPTVNLYKLLEE